MDYNVFVAKVIELLQREKRIPYRSLKRRFDVDDDYIEDLKIDLIEAKRLAVDEAETQPELLAQHYTEASLIEQAVGYWHKAGQRAIERSAHVEAIAHFRQGLALLEMLPETRQRLQREVNMDITLGASLLATKGYAAPEVGETYTSTQQLCQHLEDPYQLFPVLRGLWSYYLVRAELLTAHALGKQLLALAQQVQDAARLLAAHRALGATLFFLGTAASAYTHLAQALALYNPQQHSAQAFLYGEDTSVVCRSHAAWARWSLGYPVQGLARNDEALTLAQQIVHPYILGYVLNLAARFHQFRREVRLTQERAAALISLAQEQGFQYLMVQGSVLHGWALAQQGQARDGIEQMHQGLTAHHATGAELGRPYYLALLAQAYGIMGQADAGLKVLTEALTLADTTEERWYEAELHRLKGELLLQQNAVNQTEAETCFQQAIRIAQSQQAKSWELRATTSLARLWQQQGKRQEVYDLLAPVYHWFTEGFNTADLQGARALLEVLS